MVLYRKCTVTYLNDKKRVIKVEGPGLLAEVKDGVLHVTVYDEYSVLNGKVVNEFGFPLCGVHHYKLDVVADE